MTGHETQKFHSAILRLAGGSRIIARFDALPADDIRRFVWHCHILEHEDNSMMRPYVVV
jgi:FtsP/CotA-like multicopper oxidase with cupredoxin domain